MNSEIINHLKLFKRLCETLIKSYRKSTIGESEFADADFDFLYKKIVLRINSRGPIETISWLKGIRVVVYSWIAGKPENPGSIATYRDGLPKALGPLAKHLRSRDKEKTQLILTFLNISREILVWKDPDLSTIQDPPKYNSEIRNDYKKNIRIVLRRLKLGLSQQPPQWHNSHFTTKSGPSGPAMLVLHHDLINLTKDENKDLLSSINYIGGHELEHYIQSYLYRSAKTKFITDPKSQDLRKLAIVKDTEGKSRVIAMADYWTQDCLKPLHKLLLEELRNLKSDVTFGQDIGPFGNSEHNYWSFDLSAATDRLPIFLYEDILEARFGKKYQESWSKLMVSQPYKFEGRDIHYSTGQPMGLYSSWALLAHAHHCIVQLAAHKIGLKQFWDYRILGDDIVIRHDQVASEYRSIMSKLGVSISPTKTLVSKDTFEFAKRLFSRNEEITGFPINGLLTSLKTNWMDVTNIIETSERRGFISTRLMNEEVFVSLYHSVGVNIGLAKINYKHILTHFTVVNKRWEYLEEVISKWRLAVTCVTDRESIKLTLRTEYLMQLYRLARTSYLDLTNLLDKVGNKTKRNIPALTRIYDNPPTSIRFIRNRNLLEPMENVIVEKWIEIKNLTLINPRRSINIETEIDLYETIDLRLPDPFIFDRSRESERKFRVKASSSIKALAKLRDSLTSSGSSVDDTKQQILSTRILERLLDKKL